MRFESSLVFIMSAARRLATLHFHRHKFLFPPKEIDFGAAFSAHNQTRRKRKKSSARLRLSISREEIWRNWSQKEKKSRGWQETPVKAAGCSLVLVNSWLIDSNARRRQVNGGRMRAKNQEGCTFTARGVHLDASLHRFLYARHRGGTTTSRISY